jgi:hypothetical protein
VGFELNILLLQGQVLYHLIHAHIPFLL